MKGWKDRVTAGGIRRKINECRVGAHVREVGWSWIVGVGQGGGFLRLWSVRPLDFEPQRRAPMPRSSGKLRKGCSKNCS